MATWYATSGMVAAAGPALRRLLGPGYLGRVVVVRWHGRSVRVRLVTSCQCYRGTPDERLIDLGDDAFRALTGGTWRGKVRVRVVVR